MRNQDKYSIAALAFLLASCGGGSPDVPGSAAEPVAQDLAGGYRVMDGYLKPPVPRSDQDGDGIPDVHDDYADQPVVQASAYGAQALTIEQVWSESPDGRLDNAATGQDPLLVRGRGFDRDGTTPQFIFLGGIEPEVVIPRRVAANTWQATPPPGVSSVFAVIGNRRSNAVPIRWLSREAPKLLRPEDDVTTGTIIDVFGSDLAAVERAWLGAETLEIISTSDSRLQLRLPSAPTGNQLHVADSNTSSNKITLSLRHNVQMTVDPDIRLGTLSGRLDGELIAVSAAGSQLLSLPGERPQVIVFDTDNGYSQLSAISWPDESSTIISSTSTLLADLWIHGSALPVPAGMDWFDKRAMLRSALGLPAAEAYVAGHQSWLDGNAPDWDRNLARQAVLDAVRAAYVPLSAAPAAQQIPIEQLDDIVAFTVSEQTSSKAEFGSSSTVDLAPIDTAGNDYAQIEVAGHDEQRAFQAICEYPPNTPQPPGIWPSDLCMQNGTPVLASFAVYQPNTRTFGFPYALRDQDKVRNHIDQPGSTDTVAQGALYLTDNRSGAAVQPTLCRMQTCFVQVLTHGFGLGYKAPGLSVEERRVVRDLRLKWVFEEMIFPILADKLGLSAVPACLAGEMYASINFYQRIEDLVSEIRADRASHSIDAAKQLFDDTISVWLHGILTGALSDDQNIVECVANEIATGEIQDRLGGSTTFAEILDDAKFAGGLLLTPEKFTFRVQYRAEVADVVASVASDGVTSLIDTVNGLYIDAAQTNPRRLTITGTRIAEQNSTVPADSYYPLVIFRDSAGNTESFLTDSSHYIETGQQALQQIDIPLPALVDNAGTDLNRLVPGMLDVSLQFVHAALPGYPGNALEVPSPVRVLLVNRPRVLGFTPQAAAPGSIVAANGSSLTALGAQPALALYRHQGSGNFDCTSADEQTRVSIPPADVFPIQGDDEIKFALPGNLATEQFYYLCVTSAGGSADGVVTSAIPFLVIDSSLPNTGIVTFSDFGRVKDDGIRLSLLGNNGMPITDDGVPLTFDIPNPLNGKRVRSVSWDNNVFMLVGVNVNSLLLECIDSGNDSTCTYGISVTNVDLDSLEDSGSVLTRSDAGKLTVGEKVEYQIVYP